MRFLFLSFFDSSTKIFLYYWVSSPRRLVGRAAETDCERQCKCIVCNRPTQSIIYVPLQVIRFQKIILLIVQYKCLKSCSEDFIIKNLILRTRSCGNVFITQHSWLLHFRLAEICLAEMICNTVVPASQGHLGGASP